MLHWTSILVKAIVSFISLLFFVNHFAYLSVGQFDYQYNMKTNIITGTCHWHSLLKAMSWRSKITASLISILTFNPRTLNILLHFQGILTGVGWIIWYLSQRRKRRYSWKILLFQVLVAISLLLEVNDFPPLLWVLDAHALWHLSTVLPTVLLYSFLIDDTQALRNETFNAEAYDDKEKLI